MRHPSKALAALVASALMLTGCAAAQSSAAKSTTLTIGASAPPPSFDVSQAGWGARSVYYQAAFDSLLRQDPDGTLKPGLAKSWSYDDSKTTLTMKLRDDVTFTDKTKFTAAVAKRNLLRFRDGGGGDAVLLDAVKTVDAVDATTVVLHLSEPDSGLLMWLSKDAGLQQSVKAIGNSDLATDPVGSGPYILDVAKTVTDSKYVFTKNPDYWDKSVQHYDDLVVNVYRDATAALNAIKAGEVNGSVLLNNQDLAQVKAAGYTVNSNQLDLAGIYFFDRDGAINPAFADVRVRRAINYAFDRKGLLKAVDDGHGTVTEQIFPTRSVAYDPSLDDTYPYDPAKARALLAAAGYAKGLKITLPSTSGYPDSLYSLISQQLADVGITVTFQDTGNNFIADLVAKKYAATYITFEQQDDYPAINLLVTKNSFFNPFHNVDPKIDALVHTIQYGKGTEVTQATKDLNRYLVSIAWDAPWYRVQNSFATDANTTVTMQTGSAYPSLSAFKPKS